MLINYLIIALRQKSLRPCPHVSGYFGKRIFFIRFGLASTRRRRFQSPKRIFSKTLSRVDLFENTVFLLSCGRVKTKLFENADVTASIYNPSEHALGSLGITRGHFVYLFLEFECHSVFVWTGIFSKTLLVWTQIFFYTDKKSCVFKNIRIRVDGVLNLWE